MQHQSDAKSCHDYITELVSVTLMNQIVSNVMREGKICLQANRPDLALEVVRAGAHKLDRLGLSRYLVSDSRA